MDVRKSLHSERQQLGRLQRESKRRWGKVASMLQEVPCFVREGAEGPWRMCQALEDMVKKERLQSRSRPPILLEPLKKLDCASPGISWTSWNCKIGAGQ